MIAVSLAIIFLTAGIDLLIKWRVEQEVSWKKEEEILGGAGILRKVHNHGMMLGVGAEHPGVIKRLSMAALAVVAIVQAYLLGKPGCLKEKIAMSLLAGGAVSNTVDRVKRGYVVDYFAFNTKWEKLKKITYNLGDFAIFAGVILLLVSVITGTKE